MNIIIFGVGEFYRKRKDDINKFIETDNIVAFLDNKVKAEENFEGVKIYNPSNTIKLSFDKIILMSIYKDAMRKQLLSLGIENGKILSWEQYKCSKLSGQLQLYIGNTENNGKKVLVVARHLDYTGSSMTAIYVVQALKDRGYDVWIAVPTIEDSMLIEIQGWGINVAVCPSFPYIGVNDLYLVKKFDVIFINTFPMIECALRINKVKPVLWWIHEAREVYPTTVQDLNRERSSYTFDNIRIFAVSDIAKRNFNHYFPDTVQNTMSYGIPDEKVDMVEREERRLVFAIIAGICPLKAQDVFLRAVSLLDKEEQSKLSLWLIGGIGEDVYSKKIKTMVHELKNAKIWGTLTRQELSDAYSQIDVVVCPSWEETMSLALTEGMMHGKVCISSDYTGMAEYIVHGKNGFLFRRGDVAGLAQLMRHILRNRNNLSAIKREARRTYEENFSMETFGMRLEAELKKTEEMYYFRKNEVREA